MNAAGLRARSLRFGESSKPIRCPRHLGWRLKFSLNRSNSALLFFVPNKSENHAHISGGSLCYQVRQARVNQRSILRDVVQANLFRRLKFVFAQAAGVACFTATAQQKFKHRTGYKQPLFIQHRLQPAG